MQKADIIVIGAGPGGCTAAQRLAAAGAQVTLLERARLPRTKTCGDLVTAEGLQALERSGLEEWASQFQKVDKMRFTSADVQVLDVDIQSVRGNCAGRLIPRRLLDYQLAQSAVQAGVRLVDGTCVRDIEINQGSKARINTGDTTLEADLVILAEGSQAPLARRLGLVKDDFDLIAVQQYLAGDSDPQGAIEFHFQSSVLPGYTWMFPIGDGHINIGAGTYTRRVRNNEIDLKAALEQFKTAHPVQSTRLSNTEPVTPIKAHPLRTNLKGTETHAERLLVVGDAAGLVSPFTGEGIASAMRSGEMAAIQTLAAFNLGDLSAAALAPYTRSLRQRYSRDQQVGRWLRATLARPALLNAAFRRMRNAPDLALLFGQMFLDERSPQMAFNPRTLMRLVSTR